MARVTVEDCLKNVPNMYQLVLVATKRARQLLRGADPLVRSKNRQIVTALREIAAQRVVSVGPQEAAAMDDSDFDDLPN